MGTHAIRLKWAAEIMALMLATAGAAVMFYVDPPEPERVDPPEFEVPEQVIIDVEIRAMPDPDEPLCKRGYSSVDSTLGEAGGQLEEFVDYVRSEDPEARDVLPAETAICVAEERFLGEGGTRSVTFIANPFAWVVSGENYRVFVDAKSGEAVSLSLGADAPPGFERFDEVQDEVNRVMAEARGLGR